ncbi:Cytochrome c oxidase assembly protein COX11, mitochondrial [Wickerhamiella sorbophila]|uniref:Cytochrome c oxidase assembly protein COX11, mitochondrial n=1 Tax=Wickerhamiella sorbophila TaxID=45607 RepID=A0A2T0FE74_9ASCO|nr:Cytochrome c oxidase assembly protein COX11, mitochondrial [Wickerhamiella sorbophila]PRT53312.1 Cytochrome c oxidase assembly protein COX11, mitochondrial [Wickerhamiella sorbophila]
MFSLAFKRACKPRQPVQWWNKFRFNSTGAAGPSGPKRRLTADEYFKLLDLKKAQKRKDTLTLVLYSSGIVIWFTTLAYASVPLYRALCSRTGFGGTPITDYTKFSADRMQPVDRSQRISIKFSSEVSPQLPWTFKPEQREVQVLPGETALAFYKAKNLSDEPLIGIATYTVVPDRAAAYFSKIQCFCFDEQLLLPGEEIDMPVFFFIDPDYARDPAMSHTNDIVLHYTFFKSLESEDMAKKLSDLGRIGPVVEETAAPGA